MWPIRYSTIKLCARRIMHRCAPDGRQKGGQRVTSKEKKQYLGQYLTLEAQINRMIAERDGWMALAVSVSPVLSDMPHLGGVSDRVLDAVQHVADIDAELDREIDRKVNLRREIESCIIGIPDDKLRDVLRNIYIDGKTIEETAERIGYSARHTRRLHALAVNVLVCPPPMQ